jgi:hypothetical protein
MSSVRAMLAIWVCVGRRAEDRTRVGKIPRCLDQAVYINAAETGPMPSTFLRKELADMAA